MLRLLSSGLGPFTQLPKGPKEFKFERKDLYFVAISVSTTNPTSLLKEIKKAIDERKVQTWGYDADGDFTHTAVQWNRKAWLRPSVRAGALVLGIISPVNSTISTEIYGIYHGRFIEMLLAHFDSQFSEVNATAMPVAVVDQVSA